MSSTLNEKILLYRLQKERDPEVFVVLYDAYVEQIYRFVYFKVRSREEAEDITSDVFLKAWQYLQENRTVKSFSGLLYRIARNAVIDLYRQKAARPENALEDAELEQNDIRDTASWHDELHTKLETEKILVSLKKLKQEYQEVLTLRYVDELEIAEIAEIVGKGMVTVRVTIHRALKRLKEVLQEEEASGTSKF